MFSAITALILIGSLIAALVACVAFSIKEYRSYRRPSTNVYESKDLFGTVLGILGALASAFFLSLILAVANGEVTTIPDGCYQIGSTSGSGVVAVGGKVGVIATSGKTYTPIACP